MSNDLESVLAKVADVINTAKSKHVPVINTGDKLILPNNMTATQAIEFLRRKEQEDNVSTQFAEVMPGFAIDGLAALMRVLTKRFGHTEFDGAFMKTVETDFGVTTTLPIGRIKLPGVECELNTDINLRGGYYSLLIYGNVKGKHKHIITEVLAEVKESVLKESLYKGKAIRVDLRSPNFEPKFIDLSGVNDADLIFPKDVEQSLNTNLFTPIKNAQQCRNWKIPLKRGILLSGPFGTGKTMTAHVTAKLCKEHGWTYIYLESINALKEALDLAKLYSPSVLFVEDLDRVLAGERSVGMDEILNTIDGVNGRNAEVITIFTTNAEQVINKAMLRPGRIDAVVNVKAPDTEAAKRLLKNYSRGLASEDTTFTEAAHLVSGYVPAVIREVVERAKLSAISNSRSLINDEDLVTAANTMENQVELLNSTSDTDDSTLTKLTDALESLVEFIDDHNDE